MCCWFPAECSSCVTTLTRLLALRLPCVRNLDYRKRFRTLKQQVSIFNSTDGPPWQISSDAWSRVHWREIWNVLFDDDVACSPFRSWHVITFWEHLLYLNYRVRVFFICNGPGLIASSYCGVWLALLFVIMMMMPAVNSVLQRGKVL